MGGSFSSPDTLEVLRSYGSIAVLTTLAQDTKFIDLENAEDLGIRSYEPLLGVSAREAYEHTHVLVSKIRTFETHC